MIPVVFDASVVVAACGWTSESYRCLVLVARRRLRSFLTEEIAQEWQITLRKMAEKGAKFRRSPGPTLAWLIAVSHRVEPMPLGKQHSRDPSDDPCLACALAARAQMILSRDPDLLALGKPFGIEVLTPRALLSRIHDAPP